MSSLRHMRKPIAGLVILSLIALTTISTPAHAVMISTGEILKQNQQNLARERIHIFLDRSEIRKQLEAWGVNSNEAKKRVDSLTDQEIAEIAARINQLPAGGDALSSLLGLAVLVFIVLLITDILGFTDIFTFVKKVDK